MPLPKGTFTMERVTLRRLQQFSRRTGIPQSVLVDRIVQHGLNYLDENWRPTDQILNDAFNKGFQVRGRKQS